MRAHTEAVVRAANGLRSAEVKLVREVISRRPKLVNVPAAARDTNNGRWAAGNTNICSGIKVGKKSQNARKRASCLLSGSAVSRLNRVAWINE